MVKAGMKFAIISGLILAASILFYTIHVRAGDEKPEIKSKKIAITDFSKINFDSSKQSPISVSQEEELKLGDRGGGGFEPKKVYTSKEIATEFPFNAIGAHWKFEAPKETSIKIELRVSDGEVWSDWQECKSDSFVMRDDSLADPEIEAHETYSDLIFTENGKKFQYRTILESNDLEITPKIDEIEFHYIDSTKGPKAPEYQEGWFKKANAAEAASIPNIISRTQWGCPEGETSPEWPPESASKSYHVFHHTVTANGADPYSTVRAIWQYQYNRTWEGGIWGDIGYNYLVDQYGRIYKGRNGSDDVIGAHVLGYNTHSIGVAVLGTYTSYNPPSAALSGLSTIIAYSGARNDMQDIILYGHRELDATACPGDRLFARKFDILYSARQKLSQYSIDVVQYGGELYYHEDNFLHKIPSTDIFNNWGFSESLVRDINEAEFISYNLYNDMDYFGRTDTQAYIAVAGKLKPVAKGYLSTRWGKTFSSIPRVDDLISKRNVSKSISFLARNPSTGMVYYMPGNGKKLAVARAVLSDRGYYGGCYECVPTVSSVLLNQYRNFGYLSYSNGTYPRRVIRYQDKLYYHEGSVLRHIESDDLFANWGFTSADIRNMNQEEFEAYQSGEEGIIGRDLDYFGRNSSQAYIVVGGKLRKISENYLSRWQMSFNSVEKVSGLVNNLRKIESISFLAKSPSVTYGYYLTGKGDKRLVTKSVLSVKGYYNGDYSQVPHVPSRLLGRYTDGDYLYYQSGILIQKENGGAVYVIQDDTKRWMSQKVFISWGYKKVYKVPVSMVNMIPDGDPWPAKQLLTLTGPDGSPVYLPTYSGRTAREQHLWLIENETASHHYSVSGTPESCQNGMAGGFGCFGSAASVAQEKYYIAMRWNYCTWYEEGGVTKTRDCDSVLKDWHRHKKLIVTNSVNGKSVVVGVEEAGPAIWTERVSGLSPEAMMVIGAETNDELQYYWIGNQDVSLGPIG